MIMHVRGRKVDLEKLKQWMEISQKYQNGNFWDMIFDQTPFEPLMKEQSHLSHGPQEKKSNARNSTFPIVDIYQTDTQIIVLLELPGYRKEDVSLSLSGNKLVVKGSCHLPIANAITIRNELRYGDFERLIELPEPTKSKDIHARFENGLLIVTYMRKYTNEEDIPIT